MRTAAAVHPAGADEQAANAKPCAERGSRSARDDGAHFVERNGPIDVGDAVQVGDDVGGDGGGDQRVRGMQPDAEAQKHEAPGQAGRRQCVVASIEGVQIRDSLVAAVGQSRYNLNVA